MKCYLDDLCVNKIEIGNNTCTSPCVIDKKIPGSEYATESESTLFTLQIKSTTGMYFQQKNIDYKSLKDLVEEMEVLCLR